MTEAGPRVRSSERDRVAVLCLAAGAGTGATRALERADDRLAVTGVEGAAELADRLDCPEPAVDVVTAHDPPAVDAVAAAEAASEAVPGLPVVVCAPDGDEEVAAAAPGDADASPAADRFERLLERSADCIAIADPEGRLTYATPSVERVTGRDPEALVGQVAYDLVHPEDRAEVRETFESLGGRPEVKLTAEFRVRQADGDWLWVDVRGRNLLSDPVIEGVVLNIRDISARKRRERDLRETRRRLDLAVEVTDTGIWEYDPDTGEVAWSETLERALGLEPGGFEGTYEAFAERVHPEDLPRVEAAVEAALAEDGEYEAEFRVDHADGDTRWVRAAGRVVEEADDQGRRLVGTVTDVTERKRRERELAAATSRYRTLVEHFPDGGVFLFDEDLRYTLAGGAGLSEVGLTAEEMEGATPEELFPPRWPTS